MKRALLGAAFCSLLLLQSAYAQSIPTTVIVTVVPNAPSNLTAVAPSPTQAQLSWTNNPGNVDYISIERKTGVGGTYAEIATTTPDIAAYIDNSVSAATTYFYRVRTSLDDAFSSYSNETSVTTPSGGNNGGPGNGGSGGGGGGGGGSYSPPPSPTNVMLSGSAYPLSQVFVLKDGQLALQTIAGPDANFSATIGNLSGGTYAFSVYSEDSSGHRSATFTFSVMVTPGATTIITGIFLSPTIDVDKQEVKKGDTLTIFGESIPNAKVSIEVDSAAPLFLNANTNQTGVYLYELDTAPLAFGSHVTKSKAASGTVLSAISLSQGFMVGNTNIAAPATTTCPPYPKGDLNSDCRVNLVDFSILAYWYGRTGFPPQYDLNGDSMINLIDFSIMAYYWTG